MLFESPDQYRRLREVVAGRVQHPHAVDQARCHDAVARLGHDHVAGAQQKGVIEPGSFEADQVRGRIGERLGGDELDLRKLGEPRDVDAGEAEAAEAEEHERTPERQAQTPARFVVRQRRATRDQRDVRRRAESRHLRMEW